MNILIQKKQVRLIILGLTIVTLLFILPTPAASMVGADALKHCADFAFSTSEDFVTNGPEPPDENPIISDGDLLGQNCAVCARNGDLLVGFDVNDDLGLDAVDVINVDEYWVAFSTELDSPNKGQFTAGDLLITNGAVIPNQALTYLFMEQGVNYDIGLDAVHFVGDVESIMAFVSSIQGTNREYWLDPLDRLGGMLKEAGIDIWFSTEGTAGPVEAPLFLDGDLLSVTGGLVASNDVLLPTVVPAGIIDRGVDFGLDAVTSDRSTEGSNIHFSTEILYDGEIGFTDGDLLEFGTGKVAATNLDLVICFEPRTRMLGLDAVYVGVPEEQGCVNRLTRIAGVDVADISLVDGTVNPGTLGINASSPFGGTFDLQGSICPEVDNFKVVYRMEGTADPWEPMKVIPSKNWTVMSDAFFPLYQDCLGTMNWYSDSNGWFDGVEYRHLSEALLGGCNSDLALTVWESTTAVSGKDELYELALVTDVSGVIYTDTLRLVQLDNTAPIVELEKDAGVCNTLEEDQFPYLMTARMQDEYFLSYQLKISGDGYPVHPYPLVNYYDDLTDNVIETGTTGWPSYVGLHDVTVFDVSADPVECGYAVWLTGWDRALVGGFNYTSNFASRCVGCRHTSDLWVFNYLPLP